MDNRTREQVIANEDRLIEEVDKQAKVIQWYEKENRHNQEIIIKDSKELYKLHSIIKELDNYIESDEFNNTFHCCEERNKVKKDIINILKGSDKE